MLGWLGAWVQAGSADSGLARSFGLAVIPTGKLCKVLVKNPARYFLAAEPLLSRALQGKRCYLLDIIVEVSILPSPGTDLSIDIYGLAKLGQPLALFHRRSSEVYDGIRHSILNFDELTVFAGKNLPFGSPTSDSAQSMFTTPTRCILMALLGFRSIPVQSAHLAEAGALLKHIGRPGPRPER